MAEATPVAPPALDQLTDPEFLAKLAEVERVGTVHAGVTSMALAHEMTTRLRERNETIGTLQREITHLRATRPNTAQMTMEHLALVTNLSDRLHRAEGCLRFATSIHPLAQLRRMRTPWSPEEWDRMVNSTMKQWDEVLRRMVRYFNHYKDARPRQEGNFTEEAPDYQNLLAALPPELRPRFKATLLTCALVGAVPEFEGNLSQQVNSVLQRSWDDLVKVLRTAKKDGVPA
jgi:hypothetical protein